MERLSYKDEDRIDVICKYENCDICEERCPCINEDNCPCLQEILEKLAEYEDLEEQGKLLKLPVVVGDTVYAFNMAKIIELKVIKISWFTIDRKNVINVECLNTDCDCFRNFVKDEFGKHVFLAKEAAEAALKEMSE